MRLGRDFAKSKLQQTGLFPFVRAIYRQANSSIRAQGRREVDFYSRLLTRGGLCFDVGANLGQRSEIFLKLENRVIILEPNANCRDTLQFLFGRNRNAEIVVSAVGSQVGAIEFYTHGTDSTGSALPDWDQKVFGTDRGQIMQRVPMTTLDALVGKYGMPDFVKIDVEGFEAEVLAGLSRPLPLLSFEFHADDMAKTRACLSQLASFGKLTVRACNMDCEWITSQTSDAEECLGVIEADNAKGDLFVWSR